MVVIVFKIWYTNQKSKNKYKYFLMDSNHPFNTIIDAESTDFCFDDLKFEALDSLLNMVKDEKCLDDDSLEELQYSFMERCDELLLHTVEKTFSSDWLEEMVDDDLRRHLITQVDAIPLETLEGEDNDPLSSVIDECICLLEGLEDVSESWMSVMLLDLERLKSIYVELENMRNPKLHSRMNERFRELFYEMVNFSPLVEGEDCLRFHLIISHLEDGMVFLLLKRFLQAQMEYGNYLQQRYLSIHPELQGRVKACLMEEVGVLAKRIEKIQ